MTTTTAPEETSKRVEFRRKVRNFKADTRKIYAPLSQGWADSKQAWEERKQKWRVGFRSASPVVRLAVLLIPVVLLLALPQLPFMTPFYRTVLVDRVGFYVLLALGLNVVVGFAGLLDLGYVAFYAIGAYTAAYLTGAAPVQPPFTVIPFLAFPFAILATMLFGVILGLPTLRLRGDYLAIVTLGFHEIVRITLLNLDPITNGARGINAIPQFQIPAAGTMNYTVALIVFGAMLALLGVLLLVRKGWGTGRALGIVLIAAGVILAALSPVLGDPLSQFGSRFASFGLDPVPYYYLTVLVCAVMVFIVYRLSNSRMGRAWVAIREDEIAAEAMGVPTLKMKIYAFAIGASTAGFAGVMLAVKTSFISPQNFILLQSIIVLAMVVFGGMGSITGAIIGAVFIGFTQEALRDFDAIPFLQIFAFVGIVMAIVGALIAANVIKTRVGRPYGFWLTGIGVALAALSPVLRIPFVKIAQNPEPWRLFLLGLIVTIVMVARPEGLIPSRRRAMELHGETTAADEKMATAQEGEGETPAVALGGDR